jgi:Secretion system C-terminal sorting domain
MKKILSSFILFLFYTNLLGQIKVTLTTFNPSDCTEKDGAIYTKIENGTPPYTVSWSNGSNYAYIEKLSSGNYCLTVTDATCCMVSGCIEVKPPIEAKATTTNICGTGSSGSITLNVTDNRPPPSSAITYTWEKLVNGQWVNYASSKDIFNLTAGQYRAKISYDNGVCNMTMGPYSIMQGPSLENIVALVPPTITYPHDCSVPSVKLNTPKLLVSNTQGLAFEWWKVQIGSNTFFKIGEGLIPPSALQTTGDFKFIIKDTNSGCTKSIPFTVEGADDIKVDLLVVPNCSSLKNGSIIVNVLSNHVNNYDIAYIGSNIPGTTNNQTPWEIGVKKSVLSNLGSNFPNQILTFTVLVRRSGVTNDLCRKSIQVTMQESNTTAPIVEATVKHKCLNRRNGKIILNEDKLGKDATVSWAAPIPVSDQNKTSLDQLSAGVYTVTVTRCGISTIKKFEIQEVNLQATLTIVGTKNCEADVVANVSPQLNAPISYTFVTTLGGIPKHSTLQGASGSGTVIFQSSDQNGCQANVTTELTLPGFNIEVVQPCVGLNNGTATITIANPKLEAVTVNQVISPTQKVALTTPALAPSMVISIPNVSNNTPNQVEVKIGNCTFLKTLNIIPVPTKKVFSKADEKTRSCIYDEVCNGTTACSACYNKKMDLAPFTGLFSKWGLKCGADGKCIDIEDKKTVHYSSFVKFAKPVMTVGIYKMLIFNLFAAGEISEGDMSVFLALVSDQKDCHRIRVCSYNLLPALTTGSFCPGTKSIIQDLGQGCYSQKACCGIGKYSFCISKIFPPNVVDNCNPKQYNLGQILEWEQEIIATYGTQYTASTLFPFIETIKKSPDLKKKANCANVAFCLSNFKLLYSNINVIDCSFPKNVTDPADIAKIFPCESPSSEIKDGIKIVQCPIKCSKSEKYCYMLNMIKQNFGGLIQAGSKEEKIVVLNENSIAPTFKRFGTVLDEDLITPKAFLEDDSLKYIYDTTNESVYLEKKKMDDLEHISFDFADNQELYIENSTKNAFTLYYSDEKNDWGLPFASSSPITVIGNIRVADTIILAGIYQKELLIGDKDKLESQSENALFFSKISTTGEIYAINAIDGNWDINSLSFTKTKNNVSISGINQADSYIFNGQKYDNGTQIITLQPLSQKISKNLALDGVKLIKSTLSKDESITTNIFHGEGNIYKDNKKIATIVKGEVCVVSTDFNGEIIYTKTVQSEQIDPKLLSATFDNANNLYFAITFENTVTLENTTFTSKGNKDILFVKIAADGTILLVNQYGSPDNENVKEIMFDNGNSVYFGGEIEGETFERQIGDVTLIKMQSIKKAAYVSHFSLSDESSPTYKNINNANTSSIDFTALPNPVSDNLEIEVDCKANCIYDIVIHDILGREIWLQKGNRGQNSFSVNLQNQMNGLYVVTLTSAEGKMITKRIVKQN